MARHSYPPLDNLPPNLAREMAKRKGPGRGNVWHMLCWSQEVAEKFIDYSEAIRFHNTIPPAIREVMILRVGHLAEAHYEVHHHRRIAREAGVSENSITAATIGPSAPGISDEESLAMQVVDELMQSKRLSPALFDRVAQKHGPRTVTEMILLVGFYTMASMFLNSFEVDIEPSAVPA